MQLAQPTPNENLQPAITYSLLQQRFKFLQGHFEHLRGRNFAKLHQACYRKILETRENMAIVAPTNSGKTVLLKMATLKEIDGGSASNQVRVLYLCPILALARQMYNQWIQHSPQDFSHKVSLITGQNGETENYHQASIVISTFDKVLSQLKRKRNRESTHNYSLLILDQFHEIGTDRGHAYQRAVDILREMNKNKGKKLRIIGASGTVNKADLPKIRSWIGINDDSPDNYYFIDPQIAHQYRLVPLRPKCQGYGYDPSKIPGKKKQNEAFLICDFLYKRLPDFLRNKYIQQSEHLQTIVFTQTCLQAQNTAILLAERNVVGMPPEQTELTLRRQEASQQFSSYPTLAQCIERGVAYYFSKINADKKNRIEELYKDGVIKIICCTTALASGVNLDVQLVVLVGAFRKLKQDDEDEEEEEEEGQEKDQQKEEEQWNEEEDSKDEDYYGQEEEKVHPRQISENLILQECRLLTQMVGRARKVCPKSKMAEAYIMTPQVYMQRCEQFINNIDKIEIMQSRLFDDKQFQTFVNIQFANDQVWNVQTLVTHFQETFYFKCLLQKCAGDVQEAKLRLRNRCDKVIEKLTRLECLNRDGNGIVTTYIGRIFSRSNLSIKNLYSETFRRRIQSIQSEKTFLNSLCSAVQYETKKANRGSKALDNLNKFNKLKFKNNDEEYVKVRVGVVVQALLSDHRIVTEKERQERQGRGVTKIVKENTKLEEYGLQCLENMANVLQTVKRILQHFKNNLLAINYALRWEKFLKNTFWTYTNQQADRPLIPNLARNQFAENNKRNFLDIFQSNFSIRLKANLMQRKVYIESSWCFTVFHGLSNNSGFKQARLDVTSEPMQIDIPLKGDYLLGIVFDDHIGKDRFYKIINNNALGALTGFQEMNADGELYDHNDIFKRKRGGGGSKPKTAQTGNDKEDDRSAGNKGINGIRGGKNTATTTTTPENSRRKKGDSEVQDEQQTKNQQQKQTTKKPPAPNKRLKTHTEAM